MRWRLPPRLRPAADLAREYVRAAAADRLPGLAAETAFFVVLGIFPGLLIAGGLLGVLDVLVGAEVAAAAERQVLDTLDVVLTDAAAPLLASVESLFGTSRGSLLTLASGGALVTLSGAFAVVIDALNHAYDVEERRSWWHRRLVGLGMGAATVVVAVLVLAAFVVGPLLGAGPVLADAVGLGAAFAFGWEVLRFPVVVAGLVAWAAAVFRIAPNRTCRWRDALPGALLTTLLWAAASAGFHVYLLVVADANPILGASGGGVIVMIWVYLLSLALLLGGELNAVLMRRRSARPGAVRAGGPGPVTGPGPAAARRSR